MAIRDETVQLRLIGFREQLQPLADYLNEKTDLGKERPFGILPNATGSDAVLARFLSPLAIAYLTELADVSVPDPSIVARIVGDFKVLCDPAKIHHVHLLALEGLQVSKPVGPYRDVSLRPLSPSERGAVLQDQQAGMFEQRGGMPEFVVPRSFKNFAPTVLVQITSSRRRDKPPDTTQLPNKVALAFYLAGYDISGPGVLVGFDQPAWASAGFSHAPFPVTEKMAVISVKLTKRKFEAVVDLAHKMPDFGGAEGSQREIVLYRVLRGCGSPDSAFLDFAIALEAALLGGATTELAYRFSLYGALFLREERDPDETFKKLKNVYAVRSKLVHGSRIKPELRAAADRDAAELAKAVTKKAVEEGWPQGELLDTLALREWGQTDAAAQ